jgi:hypothetical protein
LIDAARVLFSPEGLYRYAGEYTAENCPDGVADDDGEDTPARDPELLSREHSMVLEEYGALCEPKRQVISNERCPKRLRLVSLY